MLPRVITALVRQKLSFWTYYFISKSKYNSCGSKTDLYMSYSGISFPHARLPYFESWYAPLYKYHLSFANPFEYPFCDCLRSVLFKQMSVITIFRVICYIRIHLCDFYSSVCLSVCHRLYFMSRDK